jgi:magnesium-protoporphyrin O-methyltransferase
MTCCCTPSPVIKSTDKFFTKASRRYVKQYLKKGLEKEQRFLVEGIVLTHPEEKSILDIGCGVGQVHFELLKKGARSVQGFDIAAGQLEGAKNLSQQLNFGDRVTYTQGDFLIAGESAQEADITILDKVVCCYADPVALVDLSLSRTRSVYALTFPRTKNLIHAGIAILTCAAKVLRWGFHPYWHEWHKIVEQIESKGFKIVSHQHTLMWDAYVFQRG